MKDSSNSRKTFAIALLSLILSVFTLISSHAPPSRADAISCQCGNGCNCDGPACFCVDRKTETMWNKNMPGKHLVVDTISCGEVFISSNGSITIGKHSAKGGGMIHLQASDSADTNGIWVQNKSGTLAAVVAQRHQAFAGVWDDWRKDPACRSAIASSGKEGYLQLIDAKDRIRMLDGKEWKADE